MTQAADGPGATRSCQHPGSAQTVRRKHNANSHSCTARLSLRLDPITQLCSSIGRESRTADTGVPGTPTMLMLLGLVAVLVLVLVEPAIPNSPGYEHSLISPPSSCDCRGDQSVCGNQIQILGNEIDSIVGGAAGGGRDL